MTVTTAKSTLLLLCGLLLGAVTVHAQKGYTDSLRQFISNYIEKHEVVKGAARAGLQFYPVAPSYRVLASVERVENAPWMLLETSGPMKQTYRVFGILRFTLNDEAAQLNLYQSQDLMGVKEYSDYLFLPFTDLTSGTTTYEGGRYLDFRIGDIKNGHLLIDFNKAYNPYCAYVSGVYNCPIPPVANRLKLAIPAGEKRFTNH
jgi:uncharacterized protein (DUF1684 family)